jgi:hypothetical protein
MDKSVADSSENPQNGNYFCGKSSYMDKDL